MKSRISRREFLYTGARLTVGGLVLGQLPVQKAWAADPAAKRPLFVNLTIRGGAHSLLGLNPLVLEELYDRKMDPVPKKDSELYATYKTSDLITAGPHLLGVGAKPLVAVANDISIINGIMMLADAPIHEPNAHFMDTGDEEARDAVFVDQMRAQFDASIFGVASSSFFIGSPTLSRSIPVTDLSNSTQLMGKAELLVRHGQVTNGRSSLEKLKLNFEEINKRFKNFENIRGPSADSRSGISSTLPIDNLLAAMAADLINYAMIDLGSTGTVDTHSNHAQGQLSAQDSVWTQVANLITAAKKIPDGTGSLFDRMAILVSTEFARTSWAESGDGTGHNPHNNSVLLSGGLIKNGFNLGQSSVIPSSRTRVDNGSDGRSRLQALPMDFNQMRPLSYEESIAFAETVLTRKPSYKGQPDVDFIYPGNVLRTIAIAMGLSPSHKLEKYNVLTPLIKEG